MDFWWHNSINKDEGLFAHVLNIHYQTEQKYYLENIIKDEVQNGTLSSPENKTRFLRDFILGPRLNDSNSNNIMMFVGDDFEYQPDKSL